MKNRKLGFKYMFLGFLLFSLELIFFYSGEATFFYLGIILVLPTLCFLLLGIAYIKNNAEFIKKDGRIGFLNKIIYFPYLFCYHIIWKYFGKYTGNPWSEIAPNVFVGSRLNSEQAKTFISKDKVIIIDLSTEKEENEILKANGEYYSFPILDICNPNEEMFGLALEKTTEKYKNLKGNEKIYIHCLMGCLRSVVLGSTFLKREYNLESDEAILKIKKIIKQAMIPDYMKDIIDKY